MAEYINKSGGTLILPDLKTEVRDGEPVSLSEKQEKIPGIAGWIETGMLEAKPKAKPAKSKK